MVEDKCMCHAGWRWEFDGGERIALESSHSDLACPNCGAWISDVNEKIGDSFCDEDSEYWCDTCDTDVILSRSVVVTYRAEVKK
jgi:predicted RNA-binding Zn-ribbon protein involved in translation (DUF1610 family)